MLLGLCPCQQRRALNPCFLFCTFGCLAGAPQLEARERSELYLRASQCLEISEELHADGVCDVPVLKGGVPSSEERGREGEEGCCELAGAASPKGRRTPRVCSPIFAPRCLTGLASFRNAPPASPTSPMSRSSSNSSQGSPVRLELLVSPVLACHSDGVCRSRLHRAMACPTRLPPSLISAPPNARHRRLAPNPDQARQLRFVCLKGPGAGDARAGDARTV